MDVYAVAMCYNIGKNHPIFFWYVASAYIATTMKQKNITVCQESLSGGQYGELTLFEHLVKESLVN